VSRGKILVSLHDLWPYVEELFTDDELTSRLPGIAAQPSALREGFDRTVATVFAEVDIAVPEVKPAYARGRSGIHSTQLGHLLTEMQWLPRRHPGAKW
jgi:ring-1,2-phenylacetyl-CoA epoxidase subunit PaaC